MGIPSLSLNALVVKLVKAFGLDPKDFVSSNLTKSTKKYGVRDLGSWPSYFERDKGSQSV